MIQYRHACNALERRRNALRVEQVSKSFPPDATALQGFTLSVLPGLCALVGPVSSGKSTLLRILAARQAPDSGRVSFHDLEVGAHSELWRARVGYMPDDFQLHPAVPVCVALEHFVRERGIDSAQERRNHVDDVLDQFDLLAVRDMHFGQLSPLTQKTLAIATTLLTRPPLVLLDEPLLALLPSERKTLLATMSRLAKGTVVLFTTDDPRDVTDDCSQSVIMRHGRIVQDGTPDRQRDELYGRLWSSRVSRDRLPYVLARHVVLSHRHIGQHVIVRVFSHEPPAHEFVPVEPEFPDFYHLTQRCADHSARQCSNGSALQ